MLAAFAFEVLEDLRQVSRAAISDRPPVVSWVEFQLGSFISLSGRFLCCRLDWVTVFVKFGSLDLSLRRLSELLPLLWTKLVGFHRGLEGNDTRYFSELFFNREQLVHGSESQLVLRVLQKSSIEESLEQDVALSGSLLRNGLLHKSHD